MKTGLMLVVAVMLSYVVSCQNFQFEDTAQKAEFEITSRGKHTVTLEYALKEFSLEKKNFREKVFDVIRMPGKFLPGNEGDPNLPSSSCFYAIPEGATLTWSVKKQTTEKISSVEIIPSGKIPFDTEEYSDTPRKNAKVYNNDSFFPAQPVLISEVMNVRGVRMVQVGVTPFQYNPVTKELLVIHSLVLEIALEGGKAAPGEQRLRSSWFEPLLQDMLINYDQLPPLETKTHATKSSSGYEYLIVVPNDPAWMPYAQQIQKFRNQQGIRTGIVTLAEIGENSPSAIETYIDNAYNSWDIPPVAVLLMADYGSDATNRITSFELPHPYSGTYISDNVYADVTGNSLPDIIFARMTAETTEDLETMVSKVIDYETNPPSDAAFYASPVTALGWQTERWFQICSEVISGYMVSLGKNPLRVNEIYSGTPGTVWSTATNTAAVVDYFGPSGLGYIPSTPDQLGGWTGGNAAMISNAINNGTFMVVHRDHGGETLWGEPAYSNAHISALTNESLPFIFSLNCLTGKFNSTGTCFSETFHRHTSAGENAGALGLIAASQVSYSFVNDVYAWGMFDNFFPDFMPDYGMTQVGERGMLPAFGNASGKYFLQQSNWPYNAYNKEVTYNLFHHHGDAFSVVYSEIPQALSVTHNSSVLSSATSFDVMAPQGALIGLSVNGQCIGSAFALGGSTAIAIEPQSPQDVMIITVTKQNFYRYQDTVAIMAPDGGCVLYHAHTVNDIATNGNGIAEFSETVDLDIRIKNIGTALSQNVSLQLQTTDPYITIIHDTAYAGSLVPEEIQTLANAFTVTVSENVPDNHRAAMTLITTDANGMTWNSSFNLTLRAAQLEISSWAIAGDDMLDPGETTLFIVYSLNSGGAAADSVVCTLMENDPYLTLETTAPQNMGTLPAGTTGQAGFQLTAAPNTPAGHQAELSVYLTASHGLSAQSTLPVWIGKIPALVLDLDPLPSSGTILHTTLENLEFNADYTTIFPTDLNRYKSLFICLGIYPDNYTLSNNDGQMLADYLNSGGKIYMEGGDTWAYDPPTAVHPMFNITGLNDGGTDLFSVSGEDNTFTAGMTFTYSGANSYIDQLAAVNSGIAILNNPSINYTCGVSNETETYKTIGTSFEFGGLTENATSPDSLMAAYLTFFNLNPETPINPPHISFAPDSLYHLMALCATDTLEITISNTGGENLLCILQAPSALWLSVHETQQIIPAGNTVALPVILSAEAIVEGIYEEMLIITTNDPENPQVVIPVVNEVMNPMVCPPSLQVCENDPPFLLEGGTPGGIYSGNSVENGFFYPQEAGSGEHTVIYTLMPENTACTLECAFTVSVVAAPVVISPEDMALCGDNLVPILLNGGIPEGGEYSGPGVNNNIFDPTITGYGIHEILYIWTDSTTGCYGTDHFYITVDSLQQVVCPGHLHVCSADPAFVLNEATPAGGIYLLGGDTLTTFDPAAMGPGNYRIDYILNGIGNCAGQCRFVITVHASPSTPGNFYASQVEETFIRLNWNPSFFANRYYVYYKETSANDWTTIILTRNHHTVTLENLQPSTTYQTMIQAMNPHCSGEMSDTLELTTLTPPAYCTSGGTDSSEEWIDYVKFNPLRNYSGDNGGYEDFTDMGAGQVTAGRSAKVYFSAGYTGRRKSLNWSVWIDFNRDGVFEEAEQIVNTISTKTNTLKKTFFVPTDAHIGITRARVSVKNGGAPGACELFSHGETEDYSITVSLPGNGGGWFDAPDTETDNDLSQSLLCVPNPAADHVLVYYGSHVEHGKLEIFSVSGIRIMETTVTGIEYPLAVEKLQPGVYFMVLSADNTMVTGKLIKK
ncbi:MAG: C25 family cysteine peptidase [Bacteroidales bacterium]|nr:C25 family cysteine peptidase [Bacteroidales bacterium]